MTGSHGSDGKVSVVAGQVATLSAVIVVTVAAYLPLLGWHRLQDYQTWKIWALVGVLAVLAAGYGWRGHVQAGSLVQALVLTLLWSVDAATDTAVASDGLWLAGALFVLVGTYAGAVSIASLAALAHRRATRGQPSARQS
jgi:hypothetical protein